MSIDTEPHWTSEPFDANEILNEAMSTASALSDELDKHKGEGERRHVALFAKMKEEVAAYSPHLAGILPLRQRHFDDHGLAIPTRLRDLMKRYDFYYVPFPITLFPKAGWAFTRLKCQIAFNPESHDPRQRPVAHDIFPEQAWTDILRFQDSLELGVDANLHFAAGIDQTKVEAGTVHGEIEGKVVPRGTLSGHLVVGPFDYQVRRPVITSRGKGNVEVFWQLDGGKTLSQTGLHLAAIMQVPKETQVVNAVGLLKAYRDFQMLSAELSDIWSYLSERVRNFFEKDAPLQPPPVEWRDITRGL